MSDSVNYLAAEFAAATHERVTFRVCQKPTPLFYSTKSDFTPGCKIYCCSLMRTSLLGQSLTKHSVDN
jgi:hypothetical protein